MSLLLGCSLAGDHVTVTVVDRHGEVLKSLQEPLAESVDDWWRCHPEEYYRAVVGALKETFRRGLIRPRQVAAIGIAAAHGVVLMDPELEVIAPTDVNWTAARANGEGTLGGAVRALAEADPRACKRTGVFFSLLDYLRFRMTGAVATHESFVVALGASGELPNLDRWAVDIDEEFSMRRDALPPVFPARWKVGVVSPSLIEATGVAPGVWVNAGSDPQSSELLAAVEPVPGTRILRLERSADGVERRDVFEAISTPTDLEDPSTMPLAVPDFFYRALAEGVSDPRQPGWNESPEQQWTVDFRDPTLGANWTAPPVGDVWFAWDCGGPSAGPAIQAGLGLGWWRNLRALWRKRRSPIDFEDWRSAFSDTAD